MLGSILLEKGYYLTITPTIILHEKYKHNSLNYVYTDNYFEYNMFKRLNKKIISKTISDADYLLNRDIIYFDIIEFKNIFLKNMYEYKNKFIAIKLADNIKSEYLENGLDIYYQYIDFPVDIEIEDLDERNNTKFGYKGINVGLLGDFENWSKINLIDGLYIPLNTPLRLPFYLYIKLINKVSKTYNIKLNTNLEYVFTLYLKEYFDIDINNLEYNENNEKINKKYKK